MQSYTLEYSLDSGKSQTPQAVKPGSPAAARYDLGIRDYLALKLGRGNKYRNLYVFPPPHSQALRVYFFLVGPNSFTPNTSFFDLFHSDHISSRNLYSDSFSIIRHSLARFYINKSTPTSTRKNPAVLKTIFEDHIQITGGI